MKRSLEVFSIIMWLLLLSIAINRVERKVEKIIEWELLNEVVAE